MLLSTLGTGSLPGGLCDLTREASEMGPACSQQGQVESRKCQGQKTTLPNTAKEDIPRGKPRLAFTLSPANQALAKDSHISQ